MTKRNSVMTAHRSVSFMAWVTVLLILAGVSTCQISKPIATDLGNVRYHARQIENALEVRP